MFPTMRVLPRILGALLLCFGTGLAGPDTPPFQPGNEVPFDETPELTETKLAGIAAAAERGDRLALRDYLRDYDAAVQSAAFEELSALDPVGAVLDLMALIKDKTYLCRVQAVQLLVESPIVDDRLQLSVLRSSVTDSDPSVSEYAAQALADRTQTGSSAPTQDPSGSSGEDDPDGNGGQAQ